MLGVSNSMPAKEAQRVVFLNYFCILYGLAILPFTIPALNPISYWVEAINVATFLAVLLLHSKGIFVATRLMFFSVVYTAIGLAASMNGKPAGEHYFLVLLMVAAPILLDLKKWHHLLVGLVLPIMVYVVLEITNYTLLAPPNANAITADASSSQVNFVGTMLGCFIMGFYYFKISDNQSLAIENANRQLKRLNTSLEDREKDLNQNYQKLTKKNKQLKKQQKELVLAKEQAEESNQAKAQFLSVMSHELRTPMNAVVGMANLLAEGPQLPDQKEGLDTIKSSANHLLGLINDILDFNKIEAGKVVFEKIRFSPKHLLDNLHQAMSAEASRKKIDLTVECDYNLPPFVLGDPTRLNQILMNLVGNAIKFTPKGWVCVRAEVEQLDKKWVTIHFEVEDTGIGISAAKQQKIFNMFTQAASSTTRQFGGTGLGLTIVKRLLEMQKSSVQLRSKVNEGSLFFFDLTFAISHKSPVENQPPPNIDGPVSNLLLDTKVLLVEDHAPNVLVARRYLEKWGASVKVAYNGRQAIELLEQDQDVDLVLMDLQMPEMDGYTAAQKIRNWPDKPLCQVPIVALTASTLTEVQEKINQVGMTSYLSKPFTPQQLQDVLLACLANEAPQMQG